MVSGTPLYTSIDDLHGELAFLKLIPFCLADDTDGFHARKISIPWATQSEGALQLLRVLLRQVMVRHSKTQTVLATGEPILSLPSQTTEYRPVVLTQTERGVVGFLEAVGRQIDQHTANAAAVATGEAGGAAARLRQANEPRVKIDMLLRLMRSVCVSASLLQGGYGCKSELQKLNGLLRDMLGAGAVGVDAGSGGVVGEDPADTIRKLSPAAAYQAVMQSETLQAVAGSGGAAVSVWWWCVFFGGGKTVTLTLTTSYGLLCRYPTTQ
jgi:hypothetical protein